ncbi:MAG: hypothetical protein FIA82_06400 [Melioribacter sp.]|nr:hypothetical protein [Melioribacter sp.]
MNIKQKRTLIIAAVIIVALLIIWIAFGGHIFTRTQVLVEKKDELFPDMVQKEWVNKFIWGLDLSLVISVITIFMGSILFYLFRDKKKSAELS